MPCIAIKTNGRVCGRPARRGEEDTHPAHMLLCTQHVTQYMRHYVAAGNVHHTEGQCTQFLTTHRWCGRNPLEGHTICGLHHAAAQRKIERDEARALRARQLRDFTQEFRARNPLPSWLLAAAEIFHREDIPQDMRYDIALRYYHHWAVADLEPDPVWRDQRPRWRFDRYWDWIAAGANLAFPPNLDVPPAPPMIVIPGQPANPQPPPPPPPRANAARELARIAGDTQNVHTAAVTRQTNEMEAKLLAISVPPTQQTEHMMAKAWLSLPKQLRWGEFMKTINDVHRWFNTRTCRREADNLYRNVLRGVVAKINGSETEDLKTELFSRLREECHESVGMCCEGHISRLCNVFVGFDDAFKPPVSLGQLIQEKMAAIASSELSVEEKLTQATAWFNEYAVPDAERTEWLAAIRE